MRRRCFSFLIIEPWFCFYAQALLEGMADVRHTLGFTREVWISGTYNATDQTFSPQLGTYFSGFLLPAIELWER